MRKMTKAHCYNDSTYMNFKIRNAFPATSWSRLTHSFLLQVIDINRLSIGNIMLSNAIWGKKIRTSEFFKDLKIVRVRSTSDICGL